MKKNLFFGFIVLAVSLLLTACFSPWRGDGEEGAFSISIGASGRAAVRDETLSQLEHTIKLSGGPGPEQSQTIGGAGTVNFSVTPGFWDISVEAYYKEDTAKETPFATGSVLGVAIKAGQNGAITIKMELTDGGGSGYWIKIDKSSEIKTITFSSITRSVSFDVEVMLNYDNVDRKDMESVGLTIAPVLSSEEVFKFSGHDDDSGIVGINGKTKTKNFTVTADYIGTDFNKTDVLSIIIYGLPVDIFSSDTNYGTSIEVSFNNGSADNPIPVNQDNIKKFNEYVNSSDGSWKHYKLVENVTLPENWNPIGSSDNPFTGTFDGGDYTITFGNNGVGINTYGLFGFLSGTVKNLNLAGKINYSGGDSFVGAVAGMVNAGGTIEKVSSEVAITATGTSAIYVGGVVSLNNGTVQDCSFTGTATATSTGNNSSAYVGGVVGNNSSNGTVQECYATGDVSATSTNGDSFVGGVVSVNNGNIQYCYATGKVTVTDTGQFAYVGGIVGENNGGTVENCYATGTVSATGTTSDVDAVAGGIVGYNYSGTVKNCYATGDVSASGTNPLSNAYAGGIVGLNTGAVDKCYATGNVEAKTENTDTPFRACAGGVVGENIKGTVQNCVALNLNVSSIDVGNNSATGRVAGNFGENSLSNNYGRNDMKVNNNLISNDSNTIALYKKDGANVYGGAGDQTPNYTNQSFWIGDATISIMGWDLNIWEWRNSGLPTLRNMPGRTQDPRVR